MAAAIAGASDQAGDVAASRNADAAATAAKAIARRNRDDVRWSIASRVDCQPPRNPYDPVG
jgi:hypothetical protein